MQHYAYRDIADHLETIDRYTTLAARQMLEDGRRAGFLQMAGHPPLAFLRNYLAHGGIRDGVPGFIISVDERLLRVPEVCQALGDRANPQLSRVKAQRSAQVMFSLHVDTARTWRGGQNQVLLTVNGLRAIGNARRSSRIRTASCGAAPRKGST